MSNKKTTSQETETLGEVEEAPELTDTNGQDNEEDGPKHEKKIVVVKEKKQMNSVLTAGENASVKEKRQKRKFPSREEIAKTR